MSDSELQAPPPPSLRNSNDGDWHCDDCGNVNFARRNNCNRCDKSKAQSVAAKKRKLGTEIGKAAAEKSKGLFSADDWQCNKCGNVNWARRQSCNVCNAPKFGEVEERTGFGGGYNDRGVVEYKERPDSDEEYDEFGRRRKKKNDQETESRPKKQDKEEEDEEEDDEEDDDGDLSKYDLSDWGNDNSNKDRSKSRSSSTSPITQK